MNLHSLFSPKSIAIVGASHQKRSLGNVLIENIRKGGWKGSLYFVNPKYAKSHKGYFSGLSEIKKSIDLAIVVIPAHLVNKVLEEGAKAVPKIRNFVVISSGFKETGEEGKKFEEDLKKLAEKYQLNVLGPNCLGFANPEKKLNATFTSVEMRDGNTAIVSQSGALAVALLDWAEDKKIGFSKIVSIGNKAVLDESAIINFLAGDKQTSGIFLYLEDISRGANFLDTISKVTPKKLVVVLKAGRTNIGQRAVSSHTGSLAQDEEIIDAVFEKFNVICANNIEEFQDIEYYLLSNPIPAKNEVIILTNAGGPAVMATDFIGRSKKIKLLSLSADIKNEIKKFLPSSASAANPIDVIGDASPERYQKTLEVIAKQFPTNPIVVILTPQNQTDPEKVAHILSKLKSRIPNISASFMGGNKIRKARKILEKNKIPNFEHPERALSVIEKLSWYHESRMRRGKSSLPHFPKSKMFPAIQEANAEGRKMLYWKEADKLFGKYKVKLARSISFENFEELSLKKLFFPCALKSDDPSIAHRLEKNAVALNIRDANELKRVFLNIRKSTGANRFILQPMVEPGLELIIGMKRDPTFGPVVLCGFGGSFAEIFKDKTILVQPFDQAEIRSKLFQLDIAPILKGYRGKKGYSVDEITKIISSVGEIAAENPNIREIDINPLVVYNDKKSAQILDVKVFI